MKRTRRCLFVRPDLLHAENTSFGRPRNSSTAVPRVTMIRAASLGLHLILGFLVRTVRRCTIRELNARIMSSPCCSVRLAPRGLYSMEYGKSALLRNSSWGEALSAGGVAIDLVTSASIVAASNSPEVSRGAYLVTNTTPELRFVTELLSARDLEMEAVGFDAKPTLTD